MANESKGLTNLDKELETLYQPKAVVARAAAKKAGTVKAKAKKAARKPILSKGKRKAAVARVSLIQGGSGRLTMNGVDIALIKPKEIRELILESIRVTNVATEIAKNSDITVITHGGGFSGQAQAARTAIAKAVVMASTTPDALRSFYMEYDRNLLVDDTRNVEPKKFRGPKARARFQTSYR